ncbi:MAG: 50S ribosomal protein L11 methyltransferase [Candidatus Omnitrophota bacterium]
MSQFCFVKALKTKLSQERRRPGVKKISHQHRKKGRVLYELLIGADSDKRALGEMEIIKGLLKNLGFNNCELAENHSRGRASVSVFIRSLREAKTLLRRLKACPLKKVRMRIKCLKEEDWRDKWKRDFRPFLLTSTLRVIPSWCKDIPSAKSPEEKILIDTVTAFGTGKHETTRFMARLMERCRNSFESFLDIGTGTGILSVVAFKCGARKVWAVDIDPHCIEVADRNLRLNGHQCDRLEAGDVAAFNSRCQFDLVAANLITDDLLRLKNKILSLVRTGKYLAVSGISTGNYPFFRRKFRHKSFRCLKVERGKEWVAVLYQKRKDD